MYNAQIVKERINTIIKKQKISASKLLADCDLNPNTINKISDKNGLASFNLAKIADYLEVSVDYLLGRTDNPNTTSTTISNSNFNSGNISGDNIQAVNTDENISKRDRQLLKQINSLDFQDYCKVMAYIGELIKK